MSDAEDAKRYRWLREQHWSENTLCVTTAKNIQLGADCPTMDRLDAVIDAALAAADTEGKSDAG